MLFIVVSERSSNYEFGKLATEVEGEMIQEPIEAYYESLGEVVYSQYAENRFWACLIKLPKKSMSKAMLPEIHLDQLTYKTRLFIDSRKLKIFIESLEKKFLYFDAYETLGDKVLKALEEHIGKSGWRVCKTVAYYPTEAGMNSSVPIRYLIECGPSQRLFAQDKILELNYRLKSLDITLQRPKMFRQLIEQLTFWTSPSAVANQYFKPTSRVYHLLRNPESLSLRMRLKTNYRYVRSLKHTNSMVSSDSHGLLAVRETQSDE